MLLLLRCTVVQSSYLVEVNNEHVILGNAALLKCTIPSFVADFIQVVSWIVSGDQRDTVLDVHSNGIISLILLPPPTGRKVGFCQRKKGRKMACELMESKLLTSTKRNAFLLISLNFLALFSQRNV